MHVKVIPVSQKLRHQTALNTPFQTVNHPLDYILFGLFGLWVKYIEPLRFYPEEQAPIIERNIRLDCKIQPVMVAHQLISLP